MGSSSPSILEISSDDEFDFGAIQRGGGGGEFGGGDFLDWMSELLDDVGGDKNVVENNVDKDDSSDDVVVVSEVLPKKPKKLGFEGLKPVNKVNVDEEDDDCVILDDDPDKPVAVMKEKVDHRGSVDNGNDDDDLEIVGEKGEVACRDFPHPRHLCAKFPFDSTSHEVHCAQCHCYVCDSLAPCSRWGTGKTSHDHCHASDMFKYWKAERKNMKQGENSASSLPQPIEPLAQNHITRPTIIRPCLGRSANYNVTTNVFSQLTNNSLRRVIPRCPPPPQSQAALPQMQHNTHNTNVASRSQRLNIGPGASSFTSRVAFKRSGAPVFPSNKRANTSQISGDISGNAYKMNQIRLIRGVHGSNRQNVSSHTVRSVSPQVRLSALQNVAPVNNNLPQPQLVSPRPYSNGLLGDSRTTQSRTPSESFFESHFLQEFACLARPIADRSFQNMNLARSVYPNQHAPPSQSDSLYRPTAQYTSGYTSISDAQNGVDSSPNGVGFSQTFSVGSSSGRLQVPEPETTVPGDNLQYNSTVKDGNLQQQQQTIGLIDSSSLNPNYADACLSPESTRRDSLELDLNGWLLGNSSLEESLTVPLSPVWNMFSPEPASLGTDVPFD